MVMMNERCLASRERTRDPVILRSPYDEHQLIVAIALGIIEGNTGAKGENRHPTRDGRNQ